MGEVRRAEGRRAGEDGDKCRGRDTDKETKLMGDGAGINIRQRASWARGPALSGRQPVAHLTVEVAGALAGLYDAHLHPLGHLLVLGSLLLRGGGDTEEVLNNGWNGAI
jgi:hypothetical protein